MNGEVKEERTVALSPLAPGERRTVAFGEAFAAKENAMVTLAAEIFAGEEFVGSGSCVLAEYVPTACEANGTLEVTEMGSALRVAGEGFVVTVSLTDGTLAYEKDGEVVVKDGPKLDFFRAYTDNDKPFVSEWQARSMHSLTTTVVGADYAQEDGVVTVTLKARCGGNARNWRVPMEIVYGIRADGAVTVKFAGRFDGDFGYKFWQEVPRVGTTLHLPERFERAVYCAYGPGESYCDSKQQARKDVFTDSVDSMSFPYECAQESGNRTGAQWIALGDETTAMAFAFKKPGDVSAHHCTAKDIWKAGHACDIPRRDFVELHMDLMNSGLGSSSCGPRHLRGYVAQTIPFSLEYAFAPAAAGNEVLAAQHVMDVLAK